MSRRYGLEGENINVRGRLVEKKNVSVSQKVLVEDLLATIVNDWRGE